MDIEWGYCNENGLYASVPLTSRAAFQNSCRHHGQCNQKDWAGVLFTDESRYSLQTDSRRALI